MILTPGSCVCISIFSMSWIFPLTSDDKNIAASAAVCAWNSAGKDTLYKMLSIT